MANYTEISIEQNADFSVSVDVADDNGAINLASYTAASQMRKSYYSSTAYNFTVAKTDPENGILTLSMTSANTANITPGRYVYDLVITDSQNLKTRVVEGIVTVLPAVTR